MDQRAPAPPSGPPGRQGPKVSNGSGTSASGLAVSEDGYVRLTLSAFRAIPLRHLVSDLDQDTASSRNAIGASEATILGFTEWVSDTLPALSVGWDWYLDTTSGQARYVRDGEIRSNVMLVEPGLGDLGGWATSETLCAAIDALDWQSQTTQYITDRYSWHLSEITVT